MKQYNYALFFLALSTVCAHDYNGFCSVPIADLLGAPINGFFTTTPVSKAYLQLPYAEKSGNNASPRTAQLLFNQPVIIKRQKGQEIELEVPYLPYRFNNRTYTQYWTLASNITKLTDQNKHSVPLTTRNSFTLGKPITLKDKTYTAGTRFACSKRKNKKTTVHVYNPATELFDKHHLANTLSLSTPKDFKSKKALFVQLCKQWADHTNGFIPYVFGGISIGERLTDDTYSSKKAAFTQSKPSTFYMRKNNHTPRQGIDCARLITRAAHMTQIPLYATNTTQLKHTLKPLQKGEFPEDGDVLMWRGHATVISDIKKGLLVEARSYDSGYGKVHEIPFEQQLQGVTSTQKLVDAHFAKKPVQRLNKDGSKSHLIYDLEILKLME